MNFISKCITKVSNKIRYICADKKTYKYNKILNFLENNNNFGGYMSDICQHIDGNLIEMYNIIFKNKGPFTATGYVLAGIKVYEVDPILTKIYLKKAIGRDNKCTIAMCLLGKHYNEKEKRYDLMAHYYRMAIYCGYYKNDIIYAVAIYYQCYDKNDKLMEKYHLMNIDLNGSEISKICLGNYYKQMGDQYQITDKNFKNMKEYYIKAIKFGNQQAIFNLGFYYQIIEKKYDKMEEYYKIGIQRRDRLSTFFLGIHYDFTIKNHEVAFKYYRTAILTGIFEFLKNIIVTYDNKLYSLYTNLLNGTTELILNNDDINVCDVDCSIDVQRAIELVAGMIKNQKLHKILKSANTIYNDTCVICLEICQCIKYSDKCHNHYVCKDCYINLNKCPLRCC